MQTTLYFVRHGHVENPQQIIYSRLPRFRLSELGLAQAAAAAQILKDIHPAAIYSSPLLRARQTAQIIASQHPGLKIRISSLIHENFSPFQGAPVAEVERLNWDIFTGVQPPYENPVILLARMRKFIDRARRTHPGEAVIAVTHGDPIRFLVGWAQGGSVETEPSGMKYPATGSVVILTYINDQEHPTLQLLSPPAERPV